MAVLSNPFFMISTLTGLVFLIMGYLLKKYPPKEINNWYGYRTPLSQKSTKNWEFAQLFSAQEMVKSGFYMLAVSPLGFLVAWGEDISFPLSIMVVLGFSIFPIYKTEKALKKLQ